VISPLTGTEKLSCKQVQVSSTASTNQLIFISPPVFLVSFFLGRALYVENKRSKGAGVSASSVSAARAQVCVCVCVCVWCTRARVRSLSHANRHIHKHAHTHLYTNIQKFKNARTFNGCRNPVVNFPHGSEVPVYGHDDQETIHLYHCIYTTQPAVVKLAIIPTIMMGEKKPSSISPFFSHSRPAILLFVTMILLFTSETLVECVTVTLIRPSQDKYLYVCFCF
jgi:hypothetical protein